MSQDGFQVATSVYTVFDIFIRQREVTLTNVSCNSLSYKRINGLTPSLLSQKMRKGKSMAYIRFYMREKEMLVVQL